MTSTPCAHTHPFNFGHKHESVPHYTHKTLTVKTVFMSENTVSVMELITVGHSVELPHDAGVYSQRSYSIVS